MTAARKRDPRRFPAAPIDPPEGFETTLHDRMPINTEPEPENHDTEQTDDDTLLQAAEGVSKDLRAKVQSWLNNKNALLEEVTAKLYKITPQGNRQMCGKWTNLIPDEHSIGLQMGSGKYELYVDFPETKSHPYGFKKETFELDKIYDVYRQEAALNGTTPKISQQPAPVPVPAPVPASNPMQDALLVLRELMPLIRQQQPVQSGFDMKSMMEMQSAMFLMSNAALKQSLISNTEFFAEMQDRMLELREREAMGNGVEEDEDQKILTGETGMKQIPDAPKSFFELALPYIAPLLGRLVGASPDEIKTTAGIVDAIPAVKQMISDPKNKEDCKKLSIKGPTF